MAAQNNPDLDDLISFKVMKFDGTNPEEFREWKIKSLAYARRKGFANAFTNNWVNSTNQDEVTANSKAMDYLIGSLAGAAFTMVTTKTTENAQRAWGILIDKYEMDIPTSAPVPQSIPTELEEPDAQMNATDEDKVSHSGRDRGYHSEI